MPVDRYLVVRSLEIVGLSTLTAVAMGVGLGWILQNRQFAGKRTVGIVASAAIALPAPLLCYYLVAMLGFWSLTLPGLTAAALVCTLPLMLRAARRSFASLSPSYAQAARSLGASEWRVFSRVDLPLVYRPILAAAALAFLRVMLELALAFWIAGQRL